VVLVALAFAAATIFFGIVPQPLFDLANHAAQSLTGLF
jgi:NADH:ubiquinone oxidoreductase subunit 4 (subunit M)